MFFPRISSNNPNPGILCPWAMWVAKWLLPLVFFLCYWWWVWPWRRSWTRRQGHGNGESLVTYHRKSASLSEESVSGLNLIIAVEMRALQTVPFCMWRLILFWFRPFEHHQICGSAQCSCQQFPWHRGEIPSKVGCQGFSDPAQRLKKYLKIIFIEEMIPAFWGFLVTLEFWNQRFFFLRKTLVWGDFCRQFGFCPNWQLLNNFWADRVFELRGLKKASDKLQA